MKIEQTQYLKQSQNLALTPRLQQSIQMLQMSALDLTTLIHEQGLENPFIQLEEGTEMPKPQEPPDVDPDLGYLQSEVYSNIWAMPTRSTSSPLTESHGNWIEETLVQNVSLKNHLIMQLQAKTTHSEVLRIGFYLIDFVEEDGILRADMNEIADELNCSVSELEEVLSLLQTFDPVGVCARTLAESFAIQLREKNFLTQSMNRILTHLDMLPGQGISGVSKLAEVTQDELKQTLQLLRTLNPRPGESFHPPLFERHLIDIFVVRDQFNEWVCELNEEALPKVYADSDLYYDLKAKILKQGDAAYLSAQMSAANWLIKVIHQRSQTILKVCQAIVTYQQSFFDKGSAFLKPMALKDLAGELAIHESTVSRAINHKYMQTPWGVFELKHFFGSMVKNGDEEQSNRSIQAMMKALIDGEDKRNPLSDDQLVSHLKNQGIIVARRTIAKYRGVLKILSSFERKKQAELMTF
jgi:RNA polymerase sigma-54 factor